MTPEIGTRVAAQTTTATAQAVRVEVTAIDSETDRGWFVWGYRQYPRRSQVARRTAYPALYFVPREGR